MAVPKKKTSLHKRKLRRGGHRPVLLRAHSLCTNCGADKVPHHVCMNCGFYKGRKFLDIK